MAVGAIAFAVYAGWGVLLPFALGANPVELLVMNTTGAAFAALILFARLFPFMEAGLRHQQLELALISFASALMVLDGWP